MANLKDEELLDNPNLCPLCCEEIDVSDKNFLPCPCGYRVCMWCWHHIKENLNGLCPACRTPYGNDPHAFAAVDRSEVVKKSREKSSDKKLGAREKSGSGLRAVSGSAASGGSTVTSKSLQGPDRKLLHNYRVVQRNLVYVLGLPKALAHAETLRRPEYFGQYGKITKIIVHTSNAIGNAHGTASAYITFAHAEDAAAAISAVDGAVLEGQSLRASFGTTKYCNNFVRSLPCHNPDCVYLHELGADDDRVTKEDVGAVSRSTRTVAPGQQLVTGAGGPSGTGKRPAAEGLLPPPVFVQQAAEKERRPPGLGRQTSGSVSVSAATATAASTPVSASAATSAAAAPALATQAAQATSIASESSAAEQSRWSPPSLPSHRETGGGTGGGGSVSAAAVERPTTATPTPASAEPAAVQTKAASVKQQQRAVQAQEAKAPESAAVMRETDVPAAATEKVSVSVSVSVADRSQQSTGSTAVVTEGVAEESKRSDRRFNGLTWNAVFPVPASSLASAVWVAVSSAAEDSGESLAVDPFVGRRLSCLQLLDLTLPPVDGAGSVSAAVGHTAGGGAAGVQGSAQGPLHALRQMLPGVTLGYVAGK